MVPKLKNLDVYINGMPIGTATSISFDLASQPDYSVKTLVHKHGETLTFIPLSKTLSTLDHLKKHLMQQAQKKNRQLLSGTYLSTLSP